MIIDDQPSMTVYLLADRRPREWEGVDTVRKLAEEAVMRNPWNYPGYTVHFDGFYPQQPKFPDYPGYRLATVIEYGQSGGGMPPQDVRDAHRAFVDEWEQRRQDLGVAYKIIEVPDDLEAVTHSKQSLAMFDAWEMWI